MFVEFFFSTKISLHDMKNFIYFESINFFKIIEHEIKKTIAKFVLNKISKKNDISNRIIKLILFIIMSVLK